MAFDIDTTSPADNMQVSLFPASERAHRVQLENIITEEHDEGTGHHQFPLGTAAQRDAISDKVAKMVHFNSSTGVISLRNAANSAWIEYITGSALFEPGDIKLVAYDPASPPSGWLNCDGDVYDGTDPDYADLYAVIGTSFNVGGEGANEFRVPDMGSNVPVGVDSAVAAFDTIGKTPGAQNHYHSGLTGVEQISGAGGDLASSGSDYHHKHSISTADNYQPSVVVGFIIKL